MTVSCKVKHPSEEEDTRALQSPIKNVTLILNLVAMTVIDSRSDNRSDTVATEEATESAEERQWSDTGAIAVRLRIDSSGSGATME